MHARHALEEKLDHETLPEPDSTGLRMVAFGDLKVAGGDLLEGAGIEAT